MILYTEWADAEVWRAVLAHEPAGHDGRLRDLLMHLHLVQRLFLVAWQKQSFDAAMRTAADFPAITDLRAWAQPY